LDAVQSTASTVLRTLKMPASPPMDIIKVKNQSAVEGDDLGEAFRLLRGSAKVEDWYGVLL